MEKLAKNRKRIVTERLVNLSNKLLNSILGEVVAQKSALQERLNVLQSHTVPKLTSVRSEIHAR